MESYTPESVEFNRLLAQLMALEPILANAQQIRTPSLKGLCHRGWGRDKLGERKFPMMHIQLGQEKAEAVARSRLKERVPSNSERKRGSADNSLVRDGVGQASAFLPGRGDPRHAQTLL
jgi:hypothetical protein